MQALLDWLTTQDAVELSGYHPDHIRRLIRADEIDAQKWGNTWMISRESLLRYLKQVKAKGGKRGPKSER